MSYSSLLEAQVVCTDAKSVFDTDHWKCYSGADYLTDAFKKMADIVTYLDNDPIALDNFCILTSSVVDSLYRFDTVEQACTEINSVTSVINAEADATFKMKSGPNEYYNFLDTVTPAADAKPLLYYFPLAQDALFSIGSLFSIIGDQNNWNQNLDFVAGNVCGEGLKLKPSYFRGLDPEDTGTFEIEKYDDYPVQCLDFRTSTQCFMRYECQFECNEDSQCMNYDHPICSDHKCISCKDSPDCICTIDSECPPEAPICDYHAGNFKDSVCVECKNNGHCGDGYACNQNKCVEKCSDNDDCDSSLVCDTLSGNCVTCSTGTDCATGVCSNFECVECQNASSCSAEKPFCENHRCVECTDNGSSTINQECPNDKPFCFLDACVICIDDDGCSGETPNCENFKCVADEGDGSKSVVSSFLMMIVIMFTL